MESWTLRYRSEMVPLQYRKGRPRGRLACEQGQGFHTAIAVPISLTIADGGLAQQVDRPGSPMLPKIGLTAAPLPRLSLRQ